MKLLHLSLTQVRNFARLDIDVPAHTTMIVGNNAQGKTSILETIYFLSTMSSFQADRDRQLINLLERRKELAVGRIIGDYENQGKNHQIEIRLIQETDNRGTVRGRKEILVDGLKKKTNQAIGHFNAVLFLPQMMQVIEGSPEDRRRYFNLAINQVDSSYKENLSEYRKILSQRNSLLRQLQENKGDPTQLDFWDGRLAKRGATIIHTRIQVIQEIEQMAKRIHNELTRSEEILRIEYQPSYDPNPSLKNQPTLLDTPIDRSNYSVEKIEKGFVENLKRIQKEETYRGQTTIGPHRDEILFLSNGIALGTYGSRGQVRTTMMSMKLAESEWIKEKMGHWPVLLLDEFLAELDEERRLDLLNRIGENQQVLLTTTDLNLFQSKFVQNGTVWKINAGRLEEVN